MSGTETPSPVPRRPLSGGEGLAAARGSAASTQAASLEEEAGAAGLASRGLSWARVVPRKGWQALGVAFGARKLGQSKARDGEGVPRGERWAGQAWRGGAVPEAPW